VLCITAKQAAHVTERSFTPISAKPICPPMSAVPPIAIGLLLYDELTRSANSGSGSGEVHSAVIRAALMIGHHLSISAFWKARRASGVCWSGGATS
jgi:hypothetical protein